VWVVTALGTFTPLWWSLPFGAGPAQYSKLTDYIDGYTGAVIRHTRVARTPTAADQPTPIPTRDAPVIDARTAMQAVAADARIAIQSATVKAVLTTFGAVPATFAASYTSDYPVWVVTADATAEYQIHGTEPTVVTFYVDGYSGRIVVMAKDRTQSPTATPTVPLPP
jgi:hypothetical protein